MGVLTATTMHHRHDQLRMGMSRLCSPCHLRAYTYSHSTASLLPTHTWLTCKRQTPKRTTTRTTSTRAVITVLRQATAQQNRWTEHPDQTTILSWSSREWTTRPARQRSSTQLVKTFIDARKTPWLDGLPVGHEVAAVVRCHISWLHWVLAGVRPRIWTSLRCTSGKPDIRRQWLSPR